MTTRAGYLTLFLFLSILACTLFRASTVLAVACGITNGGEDFFFGPINCGTVTNLGTANITDGAVVDIEGPKPCIGGCGGGTLVNKGTLNVGPLNQAHPYGGSLNVTPGGNLLNDGTININGTLKPDGTVDQSKSGTVAINGPYPGTYANNFVTNNGAINMASGSTLSLKDPYGVLSNGSTLSGPGTINIHGGTLSGPGTINGNVVNLGGTVQPSGTLTLGSYAQGGNGRLSFNIGGLLAGTQYDVLKVNGPISINGGSIAVSLVNNFQPKVGDKFDILTGQIQRISLTSPFLSLPTLPAGEFWTRANFGSFFELAVAQVQPPGPVVSSPEPSSLLLLGSVFAWLVGRHWRKHARSVHAALS